MDNNFNQNFSNDTLTNQSQGNQNSQNATATLPVYQQNSTYVNENQGENAISAQNANSPQTQNANFVQNVNAKIAENVQKNDVFVNAPVQPAVQAQPAPVQQAPVQAQAPVVQPVAPVQPAVQAQPAPVQQAPVQAQPPVVQPVAPVQPAVQAQPAPVQQAPVQAQAPVAQPVDHVQPAVQAQPAPVQQAPVQAQPPVVQPVVPVQQVLPQFNPASVQVQAPVQQGMYPYQAPQPQYAPNVPQQYYSAKPPKVYKFTPADTVFAFLAIVMGYLFIKLIIAPDLLGLGASIHFFVLSAFTFLYAKFKKVKLSTAVVAGLCFVPVFGLSFLLVVDESLRAMNVFFILVYYAFTCINIRRTSKEFWTDNFILRYFSDTVYKPFADYGACILAMIKKDEEQEGKKHKSIANLKYVILGLVVALPICFLIIYLLYNADEMFAKIIDYILSGFLEKILKNIGLAILGIPVAFYLYGLLYSASRDRVVDKSASKKNRHVIPASAIYAFTIPIIVVYIMFFFSQLPYFLSAFSHFLPENFSYAEYARRGFFELSVVVVINLLIIFLIMSFCKLNDSNERPTGIRTLSVIFSTLTLTLIATALSKMFMYIENYSLTLLRVYVVWFMILLALMFLMIIIKQFTNNFNLPRNVFMAFVVMFFVLTFSNLDGRIAQYNVDRYYQGVDAELDVRMITNELSPACIKHILPLLEDAKISKDDKVLILRYVVRFKDRYENREDPVRSFDFESYFAYKEVLKFEAKHGEIKLDKEKNRNRYGYYDDYDYYGDYDYYNDYDYNDYSSSSRYYDDYGTSSYGGYDNDYGTSSYSGYDNYSSSDYYSNESSTVSSEAYN